MLLRSMFGSTKPRPRAVKGDTSSSVEALENRVLMSGYFQTNLAADQPGTALVHDPELIDAQGIAINPTGTFWLSARATDVSTVYSGDVTQADGTRSPFVKSALTVKIPGGAPTGQVFSGSADFVVSSGPFSAPARFIFASDTGHITGWNATVPLPPPSRDAVLKASTPGAVYTGLAIGNNGAGNFLYAADFENGRIDVFDRNYAPTTLAGSFSDAKIPRAYSPINIQNLGGKLYVAYARQDGDGDGLPGDGSGYINVFDTNGNLLDRLAGRDHLHAPWGMVMASGNFGEFSNSLLVANTSKGRISAFDPETGSFLGQLRDPDGERVKIDGLWGLDVGNGTVSGDRDAVYFTAAPDDHQHGLFGSLRLAPAPLVPFKGSLDGVVTVTPLAPPMASVNIQGEGKATQLGHFTVSIPHLTDRSNGTAVGSYMFTAANGDTLTADFTSRATPTGAPGILSIVGTATITGGTGRFAGATGSFTIERLADTVAGTITESFEGTISTRGAGKR